MLADDLIRCRILNGKSVAQTEAIIGAPGERSTNGGSTSFVYGLGPERDSFFQVDDELLLVEFVGDKVASVSIFQG